MNMIQLYDCSKCKGTGTLVIGGELWCCDKCDGWGQLDWIEQIVGINPNNINRVIEYTIREDVNETTKKETVEGRDGIL